MSASLRKFRLIRTGTFREEAIVLATNEESAEDLEAETDFVLSSRGTTWLDVEEII